jgi:hypothetical protein
MVLFTLSNVTAKRRGNYLILRGTGATVERPAPPAAPPKPPSSGMESFVDATGVEVSADTRRAKTKCLFVFNGPGIRAGRLLNRRFDLTIQS